jgi:hypothetical protein
MQKRRVVATLAHGRVLSSIWYAMLIVWLICNLVVAIASLIYATVHKDWLSLLGVFFYVGMAFLASYLLIYYGKINTEIKRWKEDAVLLEATCEVMSERVCYGFFEKEAKIIVKFKYANKKRKCTSGERIKKDDIVHMHEGFDSIFVKYDHCKIVFE